MHAAARGHVEALRVLIKAGGADVDHFYKDGRTSLERDIAYYGTPYTPSKVGKLLLEGGADLAYAKECEGRIRLAHAQGLGGVSPVQHKSGTTHNCELESMLARQAVRMLSESAIEFFQTAKEHNAKEHVAKISKEGRQEIQECIANAYPLKEMIISETITKINAGKPVMILGGTNNHAIAMVIHKGYLFVCNRGQGAWKNTTQRFSLPQSIDETMLENLTRDYPTMHDFNLMIEGMKNSARLVGCGGVKQKFQKIGNCTLASGKAAVGVLCLIYTGQNRDADWDDSHGTQKMQGLGGYCLQRIHNLSS